LLAGALAVPHATLANEETVGLGSVRDVPQAATTWERVPLPAVPHLNATPWATSEFALRGPKVDIWLGPKPHTLGPFLVQPPRPRSSIGVPFEN
jgi:hypothetical protein